MSTDIKGLREYTDPAGSRNSIEDDTITEKQLYSGEGIISNLVIAETSPQTTAVKIAIGTGVIDCGIDGLLSFELQSEKTVPVPDTTADTYSLIVYKYDSITPDNTDIIALSGTSGAKIDPSLSEASGIYYLVLGRVVGTGSNITNADIIQNGITQTNNGDNEIISKKSPVTNGWEKELLTLTYVSADNPIFTATAPGDWTKKYREGTKIRLEQEKTNEAYYKFESGALTTDTSGNGNTLTPIGTPSSGTGKFGGGVSFGGSDAYSIVDTSALKPTGEFAISLWLKTSTTGAVQTLFQSHSLNTNNAGIRLSILSTNVLRLSSGRNTGTTLGTDYNQVDSISTVTDGNWHHIVASWDGQALKLVVDGEEEGVEYWQFAPAYAGTNYVRIACANLTGTNVNFFTGDLDDIVYITDDNMPITLAKDLYVGEIEWDLVNMVKKYFTVHNTTESNNTTTFILFGGSEYNLLNDTITNVLFGVGRPLGIPLAEDKWSLIITDSVVRVQAGAVDGTWYNIGGGYSQIYGHIGKWKVLKVKVTLNAATAVGSTQSMFTTLSTNASNSTLPIFNMYDKDNNGNDLTATHDRGGVELEFTTKTLLYLLGRGGDVDFRLAFENALVPMMIKLVSSYF